MPYLFNPPGQLVGCCTTVDHWTDPAGSIYVIHPKWQLLTILKFQNFTNLENTEELILDICINKQPPPPNVSESTASVSKHISGMSWKGNVKSKCLELHVNYMKWIMETLKVKATSAYLLDNNFISLNFKIAA